MRLDTSSTVAWGTTVVVSGCTIRLQHKGIGVGEGRRSSERLDLLHLGLGAERRRPNSPVACNLPLWRRPWRDVYQSNRDQHRRVAHRFFLRSDSPSTRFPHSSSMLPSRSPPCCPIIPQPWTCQPRGSFLSRTRRMPRPVASRHGGGAPRDRDSRSRRWGRSPILLTLCSTASDAVRGGVSGLRPGQPPARGEWRTGGRRARRPRCPGACRARRAPAAPVASACPTRPSRPRAPRLPSRAQAQPGLPPVAVLRRHPRRLQIRSQRVTLRRPGHQPRDCSPSQHQPEPRPQCLVPHRPSLLAPNPHATGRKKVARNSQKPRAESSGGSGRGGNREWGGTTRLEPGNVPATAGHLPG